ncbi:MAG: MBL fold metallo-hydrolase [candidate division WOR-3 bacterium]|nr:MBL fold metallo-hydrolase [candidate division WOR-3 bacterium]MDH5683379.1 MBL fold metallo-hydrolase [candidate division WOR-3 bacterium]
MEIKVLFDSLALDKRFITGWGVSFLVDGRILFDTGENGNWLMENMMNLNVDIDEIKAVVISHDHFDHTGGLWELLKKKEGFVVYGCPDFSREFKVKVKRLKGNFKEIAKPREIAKDIFVTAQIPGEYAGKFMPEQALAIKTNNGISALTGCAHPGIIKILQEIKKILPKDNFYLVSGGFHLMEKERRVCELTVEGFKELGIKFAAPTHCTGKEAEEIFRKKYKENFIGVKVGQILKV